MVLLPWHPICPAARHSGKVQHEALTELQSAIVHGSRPLAPQAIRFLILRNLPQKTSIAARSWYVCQNLSTRS